MIVAFHFASQSGKLLLICSVRNGVCFTQSLSLYSAGTTPSFRRFISTWVEVVGIALALKTCNLLGVYQSKSRFSLFSYRRCELQTRRLKICADIL